MSRNRSMLTAVAFLIGLATLGFWWLHGVIVNFPAVRDK
jgi:hypothetical protein